MLNTLFLVAAVIGGTVMVCQFVLTLMGMGHDSGGGDFDGGDAVVSDVGDIGDGDVGGGDISGGDIGDGGVGGDFDGGVLGDHHTSLAHAADAEYRSTDSSWLFGVLSFRTLVAAAAFFGFAGKAATSAGFLPMQSLVMATLAGLAAMYGMYCLMRSIAKLSSSGNERIGLALGRRATVYVPIPAHGTGLGKIQVTMQNRTVEYQADSREPDSLPTGEIVEIVDIKNNDTVTVRRIPETIEA